MFFMEYRKLVEYYEKKGILKQFNVNGTPDLMVPKIMELIKSSKSS